MEERGREWGIDEKVFSRLRLSREESDINEKKFINGRHFAMQK